MFDRIVLTPTRTEHIPYEKSVTHKYATTSEQAKHLEDLQKQAWESITSHMVNSIDGNFISSIEVHRNYYARDLQEKVLALFTLNNEKFEVRIEEDSSPLKERVYQGIAEKLAQEITNQIMRKMLTNERGM